MEKLAEPNPKSKMFPTALNDMQSMISQDFAKSTKFETRSKKETPRFDIKTMFNDNFAINEEHMMKEFAAGMSKFNLNDISQKIGATSFLQKAAANALPIALSFMVMNEP